MSNEYGALKTPIAYYGGKQNMARHILPMIPKHSVYIEPFFGGGAIFWRKPISPYEIVNDTNNRLITFYTVLRDEFDELAQLIDATFHSRTQHKEAASVYDSVNEADVRMAWAVWVQANMSYSHKIKGGFAYDRSGKTCQAIMNAKARLKGQYSERLSRVTIECNDALKVIRAYDSPDAFFYLDPPYVSSDCGHYKDYTADDFAELLDTCANLQGRFLMSSYPEPYLEEMVAKHGWKHQRIEKALAVNGKKSGQTKIECLTWNY